MPDRANAPRVAAIVGPYGAGKTSLLESILLATEAIHRKGSVDAGTAVGDSAPEARDRTMGVEVNVAQTTYLGGQWTFLDCPGSVEFLQEGWNVLPVCDVAVVVCDPDPNRAVMVGPYLRFLADHDIPHMIFLNKIENTDTPLRVIIEGLQAVSSRPLVVREVPIREDSKVVGYVDLVSERAYRYKPGEASDLIRIPDSVKEREEELRQEMLEHLADFDDGLLEELLSDVVPPKEEIYENLTRDLHHDLVVPVFFGGALQDNGIRRLLKALRHEAPMLEETRERLGIDPKSEMTARVFKTRYADHTGRMSLVRLWSGSLKDGRSIGSDKATGLFTFPAGTPEKVSEVKAGSVVGIGHLDGAATGALLVGKGGKTKVETTEEWPTPLDPLFALALTPARAGDDVKLTGSLTKLTEEDPSLRFEAASEAGEMLLWGQGDIHLKVALARMARLFHVEATLAEPQVPYRESIRKPTTKQGRFKRQSGGHGQFGDVHLRIEPQERGAGFAFGDEITGGVVPKQYIPAVEHGVEDYLAQGPLGFPVVDIAVTLTDGSYHVVDSSEQAFKSAAHLAMREGMADCAPVLLEPILAVQVRVPTDSTSRAQRALSTRRGQILGFDTLEGIEGWDAIEAHVPQSEMHDLIVELRSATMGVGHFSFRFDHLQELTGKSADEVVAARKEALAKK
ncbi:MAG: elongation factor G [Rhodospirillaceae bacterium]